MSLCGLLIISSPLQARIYYTCLQSASDTAKQWNCVINRSFRIEGNSNINLAARCYDSNHNEQAVEDIAVSQRSNVTCSGLQDGIGSKAITAGKCHNWNGKHRTMLLKSIWCYQAGEPYPIGPSPP